MEKNLIKLSLSGLERIIMNTNNIVIYILRTKSFIKELHFSYPFIK